MSSDSIDYFINENAEIFEENNIWLSSSSSSAEDILTYALEKEEREKQKA